MKPIDTVNNTKADVTVLITMSWNFFIETSLCIERPSDITTEIESILNLTWNPHTGQSSFDGLKH
jgi:hypothetical protein